MTTFTRTAVLLLVLVVLLAPSIHVEAVVSPEAAKQAAVTGQTIGGPLNSQAREQIRVQRQHRRERLGQKTANAGTTLQTAASPTNNAATTVQPAVAPGGRR